MWLMNWQSGVRKFVQKNDKMLVTKMVCQGKGDNFVKVEVGKGISADSGGKFCGLKRKSDC